LKPNQSGRLLPVAAAGVLLVSGLVVVLLQQPPADSRHAPAAAGDAVATRSPREESTWASPADAAALDRRIASRVRADWASLLAAAGSGAETPETWKSRLHTLRDEWLDLDPTALATTIGELLAGNLDASLPLPFEVGPGGTLVSWPTLRVFLLDVLASSDPESAAAIARTILADTDSAEEFAVALRPLARNKISRASDAELLGHLDALLARRDWHDQGRPGALEALDLAASIGTLQAAERLANWLEGDPPTAAAGWMAIHEAAARDPAPVIDALNNQGRLADQPRHRAQLLARADPADPEQMASIGDYLSNPSTTAEEIAEFTSLFPFRSATVGYRLYTSGDSPYSRQAILDADRQALGQVESWLSTVPADRQPALLSLRDRLAGAAATPR